jgi:hypothetical protein
MQFPPINIPVINLPFLPSISIHPIIITIPTPQQVFDGINSGIHKGMNFSKNIGSSTGSIVSELNKIGSELTDISHESIVVGMAAYDISHETQNIIAISKNLDQFKNVNDSLNTINSQVISIHDKIDTINNELNIGTSDSVLAAKQASNELRPIVTDVANKVDTITKGVNDIQANLAGVIVSAEKIFVSVKIITDTTALIGVSAQNIADILNKATQDS